MPGRRHFLAGSAAAAGSAAPPHLVVVLADDLGYGDLGAYGQQLIATPHIDRLAAEGLWFTDAYSAAAVCAPSRAALLTGLHTNHAAVVRANPAAGGQGSLGAGDTTLEVLRAGLPYGLVRQAGLRTGGRREQRAGRPVLPPRAGQPRVRGLDDGALTPPGPRPRRSGRTRPCRRCRSSRPGSCPGTAGGAPPRARRGAPPPAAPPW